MPLRFVECPSPNRDERGGAPIDILVLHYTGMKTAEEALARLTDPAAKVSAHYTVDRDGRIYRHVPEELRAWHAGMSYWAGERNVNARSIGIEIVNPGHEFGYVPFAPPQIDAVIGLCQGILSRHPITPSRVVAHSDVAPARKEDPGELFPWKQLADNGIGLWLTPTRNSLRELSASPQGGGNVATLLARYGYGVPPEVEVPLEKVITAFQRHFRPSKLDGVWDDECAGLLTNLLKQSATITA